MPVSPDACPGQTPLAAVMTASVMWVVVFGLLTHAATRTSVLLLR